MLDETRSENLARSRRTSQHTNQAVLVLIILGSVSLLHCRQPVKFTERRESPSVALLAPPWHGMALRSMLVRAPYLPAFPNVSDQPDSRGKAKKGLTSRLPVCQEDGQQCTVIEAAYN
jgi:hypothetical protein